MSLKSLSLVFLQFEEKYFLYTVEHDFNVHVIKGIIGVNGKKCYYRAFHLLNKLYDFNGMLDLSEKFCYDVFFRKSHAPLYLVESCSN